MLADRPPLAQASAERGVPLRNTRMAARMGGRPAVGPGNGPQSARFMLRMVEATIGFEPMNKGFADPRVRPLRHVAAFGGVPPMR